MEESGQMTIWETIKADPFAWVPVALLALFLLLAIWRGTEWLTKRRRR